MPAEQSSDFLDVSESTADYFSRSNRRGSIVSDLDDLSIPDLDFVSCPGPRWLASGPHATPLSADRLLLTRNDHTNNPEIGGDVACLNLLGKSTP